MRPPKMKIQRLKEAWENPSSTGVFTYLNNLGVPWASQNIDTVLNIQYHINRSGRKIISPLIENYTENVDTLDSADKSMIAEIAYSIYGEKWEKLHDLMELEYNPISNYDMTETESISTDNSEELRRTGTETTQSTGTDTFTHTGTQTDANTGTETTTHTGTSTTNTDESSSGSSDGTTDNKIYGFNSTGGVDDTSSANETSATSERGVEEETTNNLTDQRTDALNHLRTDNLTDAETRNLSDTLTRNTTDATTGETETERTLTRSGNIGVTTSQQMIQSSIELYEWNLFEQVFKDLDTILTISTY